MKNLGCKSLFAALCLRILLPLALWAQAGPTDQGIDTVEVIKTTASIQKIDLEHRKVTLVLEDGKKKILKVSKSFQNLDQLQVGDTVDMGIAESLVVESVKP